MKQTFEFEFTPNELAGIVIGHLVRAGRVRDAVAPAKVNCDVTVNQDGPVVFKYEYIEEIDED